MPAPYKESTLAPLARDLSRHWLLFGAWVLTCSLLFWRPLSSLFRLSLQQDDLSYIIVIPVLTACILFIEHKSIFRLVSTDFRLGFTLLLLVVALSTAAYWTRRSSTPDVQLNGWILALLLLLIAGFAISFGSRALRAALFPLLYLLLMLPPPAFVLNQVTYVLQAGSAALTGALFDLLRVPALREGFVFHLPQFSIAVERECSGIRSSVALLILALPVAHFGIRHFWKKATFLVSAMIIMFIKNGIRIVTLTLLALYVDPSFLFGRLHRQGGIVFFLIGLLLLLPVYLALQDREPLARNGAEKALNSQPGTASPSAQIG